jgi:hypothetical protein
MVTDATHCEGVNDHPPSSCRQDNFFPLPARLFWHGFTHHDTLTFPVAGPLCHGGWSSALIAEEWSVLFCSLAHQSYEVVYRAIDPEAMLSRHVYPIFLARLRGRSLTNTRTRPIPRSQSELVAIQEFKEIAKYL